MLKRILQISPCLLIMITFMPLKADPRNDFKQCLKFKCQQGQNYMQCCEACGKDLKGDPKTQEIVKECKDKKGNL